MKELEPGTKVTISGSDFFSFVTRIGQDGMVVYKLEGPGDESYCVAFFNLRRSGETAFFYRGSLKQVIELF